MLHNFIFDFIKAAEQAAIDAYEFLGLGNETLADKAAVDAMRTMLNQIPIHGKIVIGEGERDKAPMLYVGEEVGSKITGGMQIDIAVDPLEGTTILAHGKNNALSVLAAAKAGSLLNAPDIYMDKIAIGFDYPEQIIDLDNSVKENLQNIALAKKCHVSDLIVIVLNRPRHQELIAKIRAAGSKIRLIDDGDIAAVINTTSQYADLYMGIGGAPEGVLAAAALQASGGQMCTRLLFQNQEEKERGTKVGIVDFNKQYYLNDLAFGDIIFIATGVTNGNLVSGVTKNNNKISTETLLMLSKTKEVRKISRIVKTRAIG